MVTLGFGDMIGSSLIGFINDHFGGGKVVAIVNLGLHIVTYGVLILVNELHYFNILCFIGAFLFGL
jgi:predicted MFS family arabinose efflux permease